MMKLKNLINKLKQQKKDLKKKIFKFAFVWFFVSFDKDVRNKKWY